MLLRFGTTALAALLVLSACAQRKDSQTTITTTTTTSTQSDQASTAPAADHDPCAVLTKADLQAVTHKTVTSVEKADDTHCNFISKAGTPEVIIVEAAWTGADTEFQANAAAGALMGESGKAPKVGDASYSSAMGQVFYARKGDAYVGIDMRGAAVPVKTVGPELARRALARM